MSQRRATGNRRPIHPDNREAARIAACIETPADLDAMLDSLPHWQRAHAEQLLRPCLPVLFARRDHAEKEAREKADPETLDQ